MSDNHLLLIDQGERGVIVDKDLELGWNYLGGPLGAWLFEDGTLRLSAGVYDGEGVGHAYLSSLKWRGKEYAKGSEVLGRAPLILRTMAAQKSRFERHREQWEIGGVQVQVQHESMPVREESLGMWSVEGDRVPNDGGMTRIAPVPLEPFDPYGSHARTMARMALDCLSAQSGMPMQPHEIARDGWYSMARGWGKTTTLPRFVEVQPGNSEKRLPKRWNEGSAGYEQRLFGYGTGLYDGFQPYDGQHLGRALMPVQVLAELYGDECAQFDAMVLACDGLYAHPAWNPPAVPGQGSAVLGRREASWCAMSLRGLDAHSWLERAGAAIAAGQMPNGDVMRCREGEPESQGFSPDAWRASQAVPIPLPSGVDASQSMERALKDCALATAGRWREVHASVDRLYEKPSMLGQSLPMKLGYVPKWLGVGRKNAGCFQRVKIGAGFGDYAPLLNLGLAACKKLHEGRYPRDEIQWMMRIGTPTQGKPTSMRDMLARLKRDKLGQYQTPAAIQAFETILNS